MSVHLLKIWPDQFDALLLGLKTHEFRKDDRGFKVGDELILKEFNPETERYTGRVRRRTITYIGRDGFGIPDGYAVLSIAAAESDQTAELERQNAILRKAVEHYQPLIAEFHYAAHVLMPKIQDRARFKPEFGRCTLGMSLNAVEANALTKLFAIVQATLAEIEEGDHLSST